MRTIKLTIAYDGTDFCGWQAQPNARTVQGVLERALKKTTGEEIRAQGSGRTDSGVHALGQVVSVSTKVDWSAAAFRRALAVHLPEDLVVIAAEDAPAGFHARHDATRKRYRYMLLDSWTEDVLRRRFVWHCRGALDVERMQLAARNLIGTHDFAAFESVGSRRETTVRTILDASVTRGVGVDWLGPNDHLISIEVEADGFLYNMMRAITGTLVMVGNGREQPEWVAHVIESRDRGQAGPTAPPQGLFLVRVDYD